MLYLAIAGGPALHGSARFALDEVDVIEIGRGEAREAQRTTGPAGRRLVLAFPDPEMSQHHARIERRGAELRLSDERSRNGVRINGAVVERAALVDGDLIEIGRSVFLYRMASCPGEVEDVLDGAAREAAFATLVPSLEHRLVELARVAMTDVPIVVGGPTGSGKEVLARAVHVRSQRRGAFVAVNCGAIPEALVESELFGHRRGAFSGAHADRVGHVAAADGGTLFLDEIGDLPAAAQPALLRVLEERVVVPIGASAPVPVDFRLVCASHRDLPRLVAAGQFREDLWARLSGFTIALPPLADRREDLGTLVAHLLARLAPGRTLGVTADAAYALATHAWPRNVRELTRRLEVALALARGDEIDLEHLQLDAADGEPAPADAADADDLRRDALVRALAAHHGNVSAAARVLGKPRSQVQRWMRRWNVRRADYDPD